MGMEFGFAAVPFERDGKLLDLFKPTREPWLEPKDDVVLLNTEGEDTLSIGYLGLNWNGVRAMNEMTQGFFLELCEGSENGRYVLLGPRRQHLARLRDILPGLPEEVQWQREFKKRLQCFLDNADTCLNQHGNRAAVLIY